MKFPKSLFLLASASLLLAASADAAINTNSAVPASLKEKVQNSYIIKLRQGNEARAFVNEHNSFAAGSPAEHTYDIGQFQAFAGKLTSEQLNTYKNDPRVEYVQAQNIMSISGQQANPPSWGLTRVSEQSLDLSKPYVYPDGAGSGVEIWVVDTGVQANHTDFEGRAKLVKSFVQGEADTDMNGHGTHVAGTAASKTYGVAKKATIHGVKVLNGQGSGTDADVIAGIQYVAQNAARGKSVANMSLGGDKSQALDDAVNAAVDAGITFIVAAGNESQDACQTSPAGASKVFAVAASDNTDKQAYFSNYGKCVKIYAPGKDITSLWKGKDGATNKISGTSMASPHVAGVAALYVGTGKYSGPSDVYAAMTQDATNGVIKGASAQTPNLLVYNQPGSGGGKPAPSPTPDPKDPNPTPDPKDPNPKDPKDPNNPFPWPFPWPFPGDGGDGMRANAAKAFNARKSFNAPTAQ